MIRPGNIGKESGRSAEPWRTRIGLGGFTMAAEDYFQTFPLVEVQQTTPECA